MKVKYSENVICKYSNNDAHEQFLYRKHYLRKIISIKKIVKAIECKNALRDYSKNHMK